MIANEGLVREYSDNSVCKESLHTAREGDYKEAYNVCICFLLF